MSVLQQFCGSSSEHCLESLDYTSGTYVRMFVSALMISICPTLIRARLYGQTCIYVRTYGRIFTCMTYVRKFKVAGQAPFAFEL